MDGFAFVMLVFVLPLLLGGGGGVLMASAFNLLPSNLMRLYWIVPILLLVVAIISVIAIVDATPEFGMGHIFTFSFAAFGWLGTTIAFWVKVEGSR